MYAYDGAVASRYLPSLMFAQPENELWERDQLVQDVRIDQAAGPTMQRYLLETDHSTFQPGWTDDYWMRQPYPSLEDASSHYFMPESMPSAYHGVQRYSSSNDSGPSSSYISSSYSDRQSTPLSSPTPSIPCFSPEIGRHDTIPFAYGGQQVLYEDERDTGAPCVAMHDVQRYADTQFERDAFEDDQGIYYTSYTTEDHIQEGYHPIQADLEQSESLTSNDSPSTDGDSYHPDSPHIRRRNPKTTRSVTLSGTSKVTKSGKGTKRSSSSHSKSTNKNGSGQGQTNPSRAFPCPFATYGCTATFGSKNEWKRHINTQHMRLGYWRCDLCDHAERKPNDFNRKDLFIQHVRRMHPMEQTRVVKPKSTASKPGKNDPEEQALMEAAHRCWRHIRATPAESGCLFCEVKFNGEGTWDERLEHIGRHMENAKKENNSTIDPDQWQKDEAMEEWLVREELIVRSKDGYILAA